MEHLIGRIAHQSVEKISLDATKYIGGQGLGLQTTRAYDLSDLFRTYFLGAIMTSLACTNLKSERTFSGVFFQSRFSNVIIKQFLKMCIICRQCYGSNQNE